MYPKTITLSDLEETLWVYDSVSVGEHFLKIYDDWIPPFEGGQAELRRSYTSMQAARVVIRCMEFPTLKFAFGVMAYGGGNTLAGAYDFYIGSYDEFSNAELHTGGARIVDERGGDGAQEVEAIANADARYAVDWEVAIRPKLAQMPAPKVLPGHGSNMSSFTLQRDHRRDVQFSGEILGSVTSWHAEGPRAIEWTELDLYRSADGNLVCHELRLSRRVDGRFSEGVHIAGCKENMVRKLNHCADLAAELFTTPEAGGQHTPALTWL